MIVGVERYDVVRWDDEEVLTVAQARKEFIFPGRLASKSSNQEHQFRGRSKVG